MKILFISSSGIDSGSHRIWVNDYCHYFNRIGVKSEIFSGNQNIDKYDVVIFGKNSPKLNISNKIIGTINPPAGTPPDPNIDFAIVGSIEEKDSLLSSGYKNVFIAPLIEKMYMNQTLKRHEERQTLNLTFHGSYTHLPKFETGLKYALEEFEKEQEFVLNIITGNDVVEWEYGKPNIQSIRYIRWNLKTIIDNIRNSDIGLVPNITDIPNTFDISRDLGLYDADYICRFKNKSNAGRCFVFHQLGIPVIADITPSNLHILGNPRNGFAVYSKEGWLDALRKLKSAKLRKRISISAHNEFKRLYDPHHWTLELYEQIKELKSG